MIDNEKMFEEVKKIILERSPCFQRDNYTKKGRTPKKIKKVSIDECYSEYRKLKASKELDHKFHSLLLVESLTISELDNLLQRTDYSFLNAISFSQEL